MKKFLVFAFGVVTGLVTASISKNVTFHTGTCDENIATWGTWEEDMEKKHKLDQERIQDHKDGLR